MIRALEVRAVRPGEIAELARLMPQSADASPWSEAALAWSAERRVLFAASSSEHLQLACGIFEVPGRADCVELGGAVVEPALRGFGLQRWMIQLRAVAAVSSFGPGVRLASAIQRTNVPSLRNVLACGLHEWSEPPSEIFSVCARCPKRDAEREAGRHCCCEVFLLPEAVQRALVSAWGTRREWRLRRGDESLRVHLSAARRPRAIRRGAE